LKKHIQIIKELFERYPQLANCEAEIISSCNLLQTCIVSGKKILLCGNGGSSADCDHISGELLKGFLSKRPLTEIDRQKIAQVDRENTLEAKLQYGICAIPLHAMTAVFTAFCNDVDPDAVFAQLVLAMGKAGDVLLCISTSGSAQNIVNAAIAAKAFGIGVIALTGEKRSKLSALANISLHVPGTETFKIQELHLPVYHTICAILEDALYGDK
jgi:D-sedoheptulose 7-phosphate isomerase